MMRSLADHREVPKEEVAVMPVGGLRKQCGDWNLAMEHCQKPEGRILEELYSLWQEDDPLCRSGMVQERHRQKGLHRGQGQVSNPEIMATQEKFMVTP
jgi:hypothetical protein